MSINLMDLFKDQLSDQILDQVTNLVGGESSAIAKGLEAAGGSILGTIIEKSASREVAESIFNSLGDGSVLGGLTDGITEDSAIMTTGLSLAKSLLGDKTSSVLDMIGQASGLTPDKSSSLLGLGTSIIGGLLGQQKSNGLGLDDFIGLLGNQGSILDKLFPSLAGLLGLGSLGSVASHLVGGATSTVSGAANAVVSSASNVAGATTSAVTGAADVATGAAVKLAEGTANVAGDTAKAGTSFFAKILPWAILALAAFAIIALLRGCNAADKASQAITGAADAVTNAAGAAVDTTSNVVDGAANLAGDAVDAAGDAASSVAGAAGDVVDGAANLAGDAVDAAGDAASSVAGAAGDVVDGAANLAGDAVDAAGDAASSVAGAAVDVVDGAANLASDAVDATGDAASSVAGAAGDVVDGAANLAGNAVDAGKSFLNTFGKKIGDIFSFKLPNGTSLDIPKGGFEENFAGALSEGLEAGKYYDFDRLFFATGSSALSKDSLSQVSDTATILSAYPDVNVLLRGHTDSTGNAAANMSLSAARAEAVKTALVAKGIDATRIKTKGVGSKFPAATNETKEGQQRNRRIDISAYFNIPS